MTLTQFIFSSPNVVLDRNWSLHVKGKIKSIPCDDPGLFTGHTWYYKSSKNANIIFFKSYIL